MKSVAILAQASGPSSLVASVANQGCWAGADARHRAEVAEAKNQAVVRSSRGTKGQRHQGKASGGKRANRRNRKQQPASGNANSVVDENKI